MCSEGLLQERTPERPEHDDAREVVVGERRVADVRAEQELVVAPTGNHDLARGQRSCLERRVDDDVVVAVGKPFELPAAHAEPPLLLPVRRTEGDELRVVAVGVDVGAELLERDDGVDRRAVAEHVQRGVGGVHDPGSVRSVDPGAAEVPLTRHDPVEDRRAGGGLDDLERQLACEHGQGLTHPIASEAAGQREQLAHELHELRTDCRSVGDGFPIDRHRGNDDTRRSAGRKAGVGRLA